MKLLLTSSGLANNSAIKIDGKRVDVISEGEYKLFNK
jgi:hypothetical protein